MLRLVIRLLALEDGNNIVLLRGLPREWLQPGARNELQGVVTRFGRIYLKLQVSEDAGKCMCRCAHFHQPAMAKSFLIWAHLREQDLRNWPMQVLRIEMLPSILY